MWKRVEKMCEWKRIEKMCEWKRIEKCEWKRKKMCEWKRPRAPWVRLMFDDVRAAPAVFNLAGNVRVNVGANVGANVRANVRANVGARHRANVRVFKYVKGILVLDSWSRLRCEEGAETTP